MCDFSRIARSPTLLPHSGQASARAGALQSNAMRTHQIFAISISMLRTKIHGQGSHVLREKQWKPFLAAATRLATHPLTQAYCHAATQPPPPPTAYHHHHHVTPPATQPGPRSGLRALYSSRYAASSSLVFFFKRLRTSKGSWPRADTEGDVVGMRLRLLLRLWAGRGGASRSSSTSSWASPWESSTYPADEGPPISFSALGQVLKG